MFPNPAAARWSRRAAFTGARRRLSLAARLVGVNARESGSSPSRAARYSSSSSAPINARDDPAFELRGNLERLDRPRAPGIADLDQLEPPPDEHRLELSPNRLDLGELRHARSVARTWALGDGLENDPARVRRSVSELVGGLDLGDRRFGAGFVAGVNRRERVPRCDAVAALRVADDPDGVVDRVVLDGSARAEVDRRDADGEGAQPRHRAVSGCRDLANDVCLRKRLDGGIAALRADPPLVDIERGAAPERVLNPGPGLVIGDAVAERDEVRGGGDRELGQVGRPVAAERLYRLADLERVSHRAPERLVHVGELADDLPIGAAPELEHRLGELSRVVERLHEGAVADLDVEDDRVRPGRDLLGHDARGDQRDVLDRRRDVAQGVQLLVGGDELRGLADDREAD